MSDKEIIYTNGEVRLLINVLEAAQKGVQSSYTNRDSIALSDLIHVLYTIKSKYQTLSEVNLAVTQGKMKHIDGDVYVRVMKVLFYEEFYKLPLLINDPVLGCFAQFRLQLGK